MTEHVWSSDPRYPTGVWIIFIVGGGGRERDVVLEMDVLHQGWQTLGDQYPLQCLIGAPWNRLIWLSEHGSQWEEELCSEKYTELKLDVSDHKEHNGGTMQPVPFVENGTPK